MHIGKQIGQYSWVKVVNMNSFLWLDGTVQILAFCLSLYFFLSTFLYFDYKHHVLKDYERINVKIDFNVQQKKPADKTATQILTNF